MNVKALIEILSEMDMDAEVILQKDSEGNGYSPLYCIDDGAVYVPKGTWYGEVYNVDATSNDSGMSEEEWGAVLNLPRCVVLAPVN